jgi:serine kinase of HPr protein (carbohydrate metabolism regulator)
MIDVPGIVFVRGKVPPAELIEMAKERDLPVISTPMTMFNSCGLLFQHGLRSARIG